MHALLIDIGNTSLKIGVAGIEGLVASYTLPTDTQQSGDGLAFSLPICSVMPDSARPGPGGQCGARRCVISSGRPRHEPAGGPCLRTFP